MGADITFYKGDDEYYFRDSYNATNLSQIINLSYWQGPKSVSGRKKFFEKMADISDAQIVAFVDKMHKDPKKYNISPDREGWIKTFKDKRDDLRNNLNFIKKSQYVKWSV